MAGPCRSNQVAGIFVPERSIAVLAVPLTWRRCMDGVECDHVRRDEPVQDYAL